MSKPDWKDTPEWVIWIAQDGNGVWNGYDLEPTACNNQWQRIDLNMFNTGKFITLERDYPSDKWKETLEYKII